jgi:pimeloyl-ACP methyl ester carboxylesterase
MIWTGIFLFLTALAAAPFVMERRRDVPDPRQAPGRFASLSDGDTHYQWHGPAGGPVAVCVHGLTTPSHVWAGTIEGMTRMGFRVLSYDHYGRGYSANARAPHDRALYLRQLRELLLDQAVEADITLLGYSMGGQVVTAFAAEDPARVERLILVTPAGFGVTGGALDRLIFKGGFLARWLQYFWGPQVMRRAARDLKRRGLLDSTEQYDADCRRRGLHPAIISAIGNLLRDGAAEDMRELREQGVPVLALWGAQDAAIPSSAPGAMARANQDVCHATWQEGDHMLPLSHAREMAAEIQRFLRQE